MTLRPSFSGFRFIALTTLCFLVEAPVVTYGLLAIKGLPAFAIPHWLDVLTWVFRATWLAAAMAGILVSITAWTIIHHTDYFTRPYDFGRCFSLGAISGALAEALSTWLYRHFSHRSFSSFWIAGATIAGCLVGSITMAIVLSRSKRLPT